MHIVKEEGRRSGERAHVLPFGVRISTGVGVCGEVPGESSTPENYENLQREYGAGTSSTHFSGKTIAIANFPKNLGQM
jgi:hypothetical protein